MWMSAWCWMAPVSTFASTVREPSSASAGPATSCTLMATPVLVSHSLTQFHCCLPAYLKLLIDMHAVGQKKKKTQWMLPHFVILCLCLCVFVYTDIDECKLQNGGCSHTCSNSLGGHTCHCPPPLLLGTDNLSCTSMCLFTSISHVSHLTFGVRKYSNELSLF